MTPVLMAMWVLAADAQSEPKVTVETVTVNGETAKAGSAAEVSRTASTAGSAGQVWSVVTARTVGQGSNSLQGGFGFPGVHVTFLHGVAENLDLGLRLSGNYGLEGQVSCPNLLCPGNSLVPGFKVQGVARLKFYDQGKLNLGGSFSPGLIFYYDRLVGTQAGFALPLSLTLGVVASSAMNVGITLELPVWLKFGRGSGVVLPILMGAGFEYFITSALVAWFDMRMGPSIWSNGVAATFTFDGKLGIGWRF